MEEPSKLILGGFPSTFHISYVFSVCASKNQCCWGFFCEISQKSFTLSQGGKVAGGVSIKVKSDKVQQRKD